MNLFRQLFLVYTLAGLCASRIGLLVHEFVGHGGVAYARGATLSAWRLFLFGGGWVQYWRANDYLVWESVAIALAGVVMECLAALVIGWLCRNRDELWARMARLVALLLCFHSCWYLAMGTHYGFGDGRILHLTLPEFGRLVLVVFLCFGICVTAFLVTRNGLTIAAGRGLLLWRRRVVLTVTAAAAAGLVHGALFLGEQALINPDDTYEAVMQRQAEREAFAAVAQARAERARMGEKLAHRQERQIYRTVLIEKRPWPLRPFVLVAVLLCVMAAAYRDCRTKHQPTIPWSRQAVVPAVLFLIVVLATIAVIDALGR